MKELSVLLGTGEIEVLNAMQEMQDEGIICGYHTMIDWEKTGIERVTALIEVRVTPQRGKGYDRVAEKIYNKIIDTAGSSPFANDSSCKTFTNVVAVFCTGEKFL
jgi:DNA-binding Lrp family transcriptional regulator